MSENLIKAMIEAESNGESRKHIAARLGIGEETIQVLVETYEEEHGVGTWKSLIAEKRNQGVLTDANWDDMEQMATARLVEKLNNRQVSSVSDLLAIARVASQAQRRGDFASIGHSKETRIGIVLPSGDMGAIQLSLSPAAAKATQEENDMAHARQTAMDYESLNDPVEIRNIADDDTQ